MARSQNPMEAFRREQKKKELKKNQSQRQKEKQAKLHELDVDEIRDRLKKLERQVQQNPADGPTRKRKQELEDTLQAVLKKQKAMEDEQKAKEEAAKPSTTLDDINAANRERYQNPENSIYYHPVLNPFGAPPPGRPQMYRVPPPKPVAAPKPAASQSGQQGQQHHKSHRPGGGGPRPAARPHATAVHQSGLAKPQRPGKRPPLPPGPPPPGTIQVPSRPPLPSDSGAVSHRPPPPPPAPNAVAPPPPPPPALLHPGAPSPVIPASTVDTCMEDSGVVGVYPPSDTTEDAKPERVIDSDFYQHHTESRQDRVEGTEEDTLERAEQQQRLRSLVPTTLRVQRTAKTKTVATAVPRPLAPPPGPSLPPAPLPAAASASEVYNPADAASSVSSEFDAFMEEMKSLGAV